MVSLTVNDAPAPSESPSPLPSGTALPECPRDLVSSLVNRGDCLPLPAGQLTKATAQRRQRAPESRCWQPYLEVASSHRPQRTWMLPDAEPSHRHVSESPQPGRAGCRGVIPRHAGRDSQVLHRRLCVHDSWTDLPQAQASPRTHRRAELSSLPRSCGIPHCGEATRYSHRATWPGGHGWSLLSVR
jgi:hypothetical protein